jgi:hypothetical protein
MQRRERENESVDLVSHMERPGFRLQQFRVAIEIIVICSRIHDVGGSICDPSLVQCWHGYGVQQERWALALITF